jgi:hypothetical protein
MVRLTLPWREPDSNPQSRREQLHYLVEPVACTPAAGWEKGQVVLVVCRPTRALNIVPFVKKLEYQDAVRNAFDENRRRPMSALPQGTPAS